MQLKPQDFLVALKLVAWVDQRWTYARLAHELGLSASEAHACIKRGLLADLLVGNALLRMPAPVSGVEEPAAVYRVRRRPRRARAGATEASVPEAGSADNPVHVNARNLAEFAVHGARYAFPPERLGMTVGVPTSHSAPAFAGVFAPGGDDLVWPHPQGTVRGQGLVPLHPGVSYAVQLDAKLYELLALFDALRAGRARERGMAIQRLPTLIHPEAVRPTQEDLRG